jgi:hypothetical protein
MDTITTAAVTEQLKSIIDEMLAFEKLPVRYTRTRDGWAGYRDTSRGPRRLTKFYFSEQGAREAVIARDAANVPVK